MQQISAETAVDLVDVETVDKLFPARSKSSGDADDLLEANRQQIAIDTRHTPTEIPVRAHEHDFMDGSFLSNLSSRDYVLEMSRQLCIYQ